MPSALVKRTLNHFVKRSQLVRAAVRAVWILGTGLFVLFMVRAFVGQVYHVESGSMEPTLWGDEGGGEYVFVRFDRSQPGRQDLVVVRRTGEDTPIVKRVLGLPGESVRVVQGDVLIDRQRLRPSEPRADPVVVFDDRWHKVEDRFVILEEQSRMWKKSGAEWHLDAREVPTTMDKALLVLRDPLQDDYLGPDHEIVRGSAQANDARIDCEVRFEDATGRVRLRLTEMRDTFEAILARVDETTAEITVTRRNTSDSLETLATAQFALPVGAWMHFWFENRDNALKVGFDGPGSPLVMSYKENAPNLSEGLDPDKAYGYRVAFGGEGGRFAFRSIRVARDLVYTNQGSFGVLSEVRLGPTQFFLLGDNSSRSRDSREWGPIELSEIVGRPVAVVWPPSRWRALGRPETGSKD
ncbi:MAG: signal peptidase I [Planctomycetes bacterium]|nr:signal peptidase I [Planctomycetota bacterium]